VFFFITFVEYVSKRMNAISIKSYLNLLIFLLWMFLFSCSIDLTQTKEYDYPLPERLFDINEIRAEIHYEPTSSATYQGRKAALYRWWRFMWRQGMDMTPFDSIANQLINVNTNTQEACQVVDAGFAKLESMIRNPKYIPLVKGSAVSGNHQKTDWPMYHSSDGSLRGFSPDPGPSKGSISWKFPKTNGWDASVVIENGLVFTSGAGSDVIAYCLDEETGKILWKGRQMSHGYYGRPGSKTAPIVTEEDIVIKAGRFLHFFDKETGKISNSENVRNIISGGEANRPFLYYNN
jgi:hypothetical protein